MIYKIQRYIALIAVFAMTFSLSACGRVVTVGAGKRFEDARVEEILAEMDESDKKTFLYAQTPTAERKVSLILEGYTDEASMMSIADTLGEQSIKAVVFLSAETVTEHPEAAKYMADAGVEIGNYGLTGSKNMEQNSAEKNARQLYKTQESIFQASGTYPSFFRCNGSEYSDELLRIGLLAGLDGAVLPTVFLNHRSFLSRADAENFAKKLPRGAIISLKLGQELDADEFDRGEALDEKPADDKQPTIVDGAAPDTQAKCDNVVNVLTWLLDALEQEKLEIVSLPELEASRMTLSREPMEIDADALRRLDPSLYAKPLTPEPLGVQESKSVENAYFDDAVFIGDSVTVRLCEYVSRRRAADASFMGGAQFLASVGLGVGNALCAVSPASRHPTFDGSRMAIEDAVRLTGARKVYIMLGVNDVSLYSVQQFIDNYNMLLYLIESKSPDAEIYIQSITPGIYGREQPPSNESIFAYDLALVKLCLAYGYYYIDIASALRDENGALADALCSDPEGMGLHFNDRACDLWIDYLYTHTASSRE